MPDHRVPYRRDLLRRFQAWEAKKGHHRLCYASGHRQHQVCRFEHADCGKEKGQVGCHTTLQTSFTKGTVDQVLLVWLDFYRNVAKAEVFFQLERAFATTQLAAENAQEDV